VTAQDRLTLRNAYLYLVCLITLVVAIFAAVSLVRSIVALAYPDPGAYGYYPYYPAEPGMEGASISDEERERQEQLAEDAARRQALLDVVGSATTLLIAAPVYVYHWRRVQAELPWRNAQEVAGGQPAPGGPQNWGGQQAPGGPPAP
jgi:hypothetical protein